MPVHTARQFIRPVSALWQGKPMKMKNACRRVLLTRTNWAFPSLSPASKTDALWGQETIPHDARRCMIVLCIMQDEGWWAMETKRTLGPRTFMHDDVLCSIVCPLLVSQFVLFRIIYTIINTNNSNFIQTIFIQL